ncbi:MAG: PadR family transcriptional regulator [Actinobacteria bacterium HGW-Actinobacteria-1]|jgi:PadR family transcriptional regulator PadR|nr:MAG: PadR family transcriptional regulator [Actinobacteria bacterium HGW-Actinobacteria-1]
MGGDFESYSAQLRKGVVQLLVLQVLSSESLYGYALVKRLEELGEFVAGEGTVYPVLRRLEADGLLSADWVNDTPGNPRKYYSVTEAGAAFLARTLEEWDRIVTAVHGLRGAER